MCRMFELQPTLRGELVELRPLREDDFEALYAVASDPLVWEQHPNPERAQEPVFRQFFRDAMDSGGAFAIIDAKTRDVIGSTRFANYKPDTREVEIGWTFLARSRWGGAHNGEAKRLMLDHAFRFVDRVVFIIGPQNMRSRRAVEKIGAAYVGPVVKDGAERVVYEIRRAV